MCKKTLPVLFRRSPQLRESSGVLIRIKVLLMISDGIERLRDTERCYRVSPIKRNSMPSHSIAVLRRCARFLSVGKADFNSTFTCALRSQSFSFLLRFASFLFFIPVLWTSDFTQTHRIDFKYFLKFHQATTEKKFILKNYRKFVKFRGIFVRFVT